MSISTHDLLGRVLTLDGPWSGDSDTLTWTYNDATRQVTRTATGAEGNYSETTTADTLGRLAWVVNPLGTFTMAYSGNTGRATAITHSGGFDTTFSYTGPEQGRALAGILSKIPGGATVAQHSYTYDNLGQIATWKREAPLANPGTTHQYQWTLAHDYSGQLTSAIEKDLSGGLRDSWAFGYDPAGNRRSATRSGAPGATAQAMTASHNPMNQITTLGGGGQTLVAGSLDEPGQAAVGIAGQGDHPARMLSGNRFESELDLPTGTSTLQLTATDPTGNTSQKQYTVATAPQTARTVTHDADGNMTSDGDRSYEWDAWSRLTKITWATGKTTAISYNALGQRSKLVHTDGGTTRTEYLLYDGAELLQRRTGGSAASNTDRVYFAQGERRKVVSTWTNHHYTRDHLGSVREVLASDGSLLARYDYTPYGERETRYEASGYEGTDFGFTGHFTLRSQVTGQADLVLAHFRAYDPLIGRWLSQDPLGEDGGLNLYGYVGGSVAEHADPSGLFGIAFGNRDGTGVHFNLGWGEPSLVFSKDTFTEDLPQSAAATADGIIPFSDPFAASGAYDPCDKNHQTSQMLGGVARDLGVAALTGGVSLARGGTARILAGGHNAAGIYQFSTRTGTYIGQSSNIGTRLARHGSRVLGNVKRWKVGGSQLQREIAEQLRIDKFGLSNLANIRNPMGGRRGLIVKRISAEMGALWGAGASSLGHSSTSDCP